MGRAYNSCGISSESMTKGGRERERRLKACR